MLVDKSHLRNSNVESTNDITLLHEKKPIQRDVNICYKDYLNKKKTEKAPFINELAIGIYCKMEEKYNIDFFTSGIPNYDDFIKSRRLMEQTPNEYLGEIYNNILIEEKTRGSPKYGYMKYQTDINEKMRAILIDWLVDVHLRFKMRVETLYLTTAIIDEYLSLRSISRNKLQLLGVSALLIASKFEEIYIPEIGDFVYITDNAYSKSEILKTEFEILSLFEFNVNFPSPYAFYELYCQKYKLTKSQFFLGRYFIELFLIDYRQNRYYPSQIALSAIYMIFRVYEDKSINEFIINHNAELNVIELCIKDIMFLINNIEQSTLKSVQSKFALEEYCNVSTKASKISFQL